MLSLIIFINAKIIFFKNYEEYMFFKKKYIFMIDWLDWIRQKHFIKYNDRKIIRDR